MRRCDVITVGVISKKRKGSRVVSDDVINERNITGPKVNVIIADCRYSRRRYIRRKNTLTGYHFRRDQAAVVVIADCRYNRRRYI